MQICTTTRLHNPVFLWNCYNQESSWWHIRRFVFSLRNEIKVASREGGRARLYCLPWCVCSLLSPLRQMCNFPVSVSYSLFNSPSPTQDIRSMGTFTPHCHIPTHPTSQKKKAQPQQMSCPLHPYWASVSVTTPATEYLSSCHKSIWRFCTLKYDVWIFFGWMLAERIGCERQVKFCIDCQ